jgi:hypothetical protein
MGFLCHKLPAMNQLPASINSAADRNKQPILEVLREWLPGQGRALEIASGNGQHLAWFSKAFAHWTWQPSDQDVLALPGIAATVAAAAAVGVNDPVRLDVLDTTWPSDGTPFTEPFDLVYCANMLHIAPWACCAALMRGASRHLAAAGVLVLYGPYLEHDIPTAAGNLAFDQSLRARNAAWGIRQLEDVRQQAALAGLTLQMRRAMPANNLMLAFVRDQA